VSVASRQNVDDSAALRQVRRAWLSLSIAMLVLVLILAALAAAATFYLRHATQPEQATLDVVGGSGALIRSPGDSDYRLITGNTTLSEGDEVSTSLGTVLWVTLFDGSTVEIAEDTVLKVSRMRSSRFIDSTKHVILEPRHGTIYVAMAPRGQYGYSELTVKTEAATITMADGNGTTGVGSFLVEVQSVVPGAPEGSGDHWTRAAVLRGTAMLHTDSESLRLGDDQQVRVESDGELGDVTSAVRQLISDGSFRYGLTSWVEFHDAGAGGDAPTSSGAVELVTDWINGDGVIAVEFLRSTGDPRPAQTGIRQRIGQTLRVYSSVRLEFHLKISAQDPPGGGSELAEFPLVVELNYVDIMGEERQWTRRFYAVPDPERPVPLDTASRVDLNTWEHVIFELHNLSPLPRQVTSVVLYASGQSYQTLITNVSLTSSELGQSGQ
jgi:hypothetical protein